MGMKLAQNKSIDELLICICRKICRRIDINICIYVERDYAIDLCLYKYLLDKTFNQLI